MKKILIVFGIFVAGESAFSQDLHFSQYYENPSLLNPAMCGANYVMRTSVIYKDQWRSVTVPYKTFGASIDMKFKASNWDKVDQFKTMTFKKSFNRLAGGLAFYSDKAGDGNMGTNSTQVSLATFIKGGEHSSFSLGLQAGVVQKTVDYNKLIFSNQYNGTQYDPTVNSNEPYGSQSFVYPDFAGGLLWNYSKEESSIGENNHMKADFGVGIFHINRPKQKFLVGTDEKLFSKYTVHGRLIMGIPHSNVGIAPSVIVQVQGPTKEIIGGLMLKYYLKDDSKYTGFVKRSAIGVGVYYRAQDAVILNLLVEMGQYAIGFTYDINTSALTKVSTLRGGPELMLRFNTANPYLFQKRH